MSEQQKATPKHRRWFRWLRRLGVLFVVCALLISLALFYLYNNLTGVVVWFANRSHPRLLLDLEHAGFSGNNRIELKNLVLKLDKENEKVLVLDRATVGFAWADLWNRRIASIHIENPVVTLTDRALVPKEPGIAKKMELTTPSGLWLVDEFKVEGGKATVNLAGFPVAKFNFSSSLHSVYLSSETKFSTQLQSVNITAVEILNRDPNPLRFGTIKAISANFVLSEISANRLEELTIDTPSAWLTPGLLALFSPSSPALPESSSAVPGSVQIPWVIHKLHVKEGQFFMDGFGNRVPVISLKLAMDEDDFQIGANEGILSEKAHKLQIWDVRVAAAFAPLDPFLWLGSAQIDFTSRNAFGKKRLDAITITAMDLQMGQKFRSLLAAIDAPDKGKSLSPANPGAGTASPWKVGEFRIINGRATIADLGDELPDIAFKLDTDLHEVALSDDLRYANKDVEEVTISNLNIHSQQDPYIPVLNFARIHLRFSVAQILHQEIDSVNFEKPTIFVSEQLFWFADELKRRQASATPTTASAPSRVSAPDWHINKFTVEGGNLVVANAGQSGVTMPFEFSTEVDNLHFNKLSDLQLKLKLEIKKGDYAFPSYELEFKQLFGKIDFGLPPDTGAKDVVQTLHAEGAVWKEFQARKLWLSVTYDQEGIYGSFGGAGYNGYLTGAFQFYMNGDTPWTGWVSGTKIDLKQVTDILAPQNFQMSGPASFNVEVNGLNHEIERVAGSVTTTKNGQLKIAKLDDIIKNIPDSWSSFKQGTTRIALETLRDFDYTHGNGDFWYAGGRGHLTLKMRGPHGSRNFDITLHGDK